MIGGDDYKKDVTNIIPGSPIRLNTKDSKQSRLTS